MQEEGVLCLYLQEFLCLLVPYRFIWNLILLHALICLHFPPFPLPIFNSSTFHFLFWTFSPIPSKLYPPFSSHFSKFPTICFWIFPYIHKYMYIPVYLLRKAGAGERALTWHEGSIAHPMATVITAEVITVIMSLLTEEWGVRGGDSGLLGPGYRHRSAEC